jgi:hypothetical protein
LHPAVPGDDVEEVRVIMRSDLFPQTADCLPPKGEGALNLEANRLVLRECSQSAKGDLVPNTRHNKVKRKVFSMVDVLGRKGAYVVSVPVKKASVVSVSTRYL